MSPVKVKKARRRAQLSCDRCRLIKRKCSRDSPCERCIEDEEDCTFNRAQLTKNASQKRRHMDQTLSEGSTSKSTNTTPASHSVLSTSTQHTKYLDLFGDPEALRRLIAHPVFLERVLHIYFREIGWYTDLVSGTRLHRLVSERQDPRNTWPGLWEEIEILAIATTALVAQACPSDVEAVLVSLPPESRQGFCMAEVIARTAHTVASDKTARLASTTTPQDWPAETHASSVLLRIFDKNSDLNRTIGEKILVDIARMQRAKIHQMNVSQPSPGRDNGKSRIWQAEHDLLGYRVFWHLLFEDRIVAMLYGSAFAIQAKHCNICLHDPFGHVSIQELCGESDSDMNGEKGCDCDGSTTLHLDLFSGACARISVINGRYYEKLSATRTSTFRWPEDAEQMAAQLELELLAFEADLSTMIARDPDCLLPGQEDALALYVARARRDVAKQLCDGFAISLLQTGSSQSSNIDPLAVEWMLERRKLDTAKDLITRVMEAPRRLPIRTAFNHLFYSKFIHQQTMELLQGAEGWFQSQRCSHFQQDRNVSLHRQGYYIDCLRLALAGRNLLVLSSRRSELRAAKRLNVEVVERCARMLRQLVPKEINVGNESSIVNDAAILNALKAQPWLQVESGQDNHSSEQSIISPASFTTTNPNTDMDQILNGLFADLPALEQLFSFGVPSQPLLHV